MKEFLKNNWKLVCPLLILLLFVVYGGINNCSRNQQADQNTNSAVAQNEIDNLKAKLADKDKMLFVHKIAEDSLNVLVKAKDVQISQFKIKYRDIANKYETERGKLKEITNDSAVALFLDRADCIECPVLKYENAYLVEIDPIRFYNDLASGFDEQVEVNQVLRNNIDTVNSKVLILNELIKHKDEDIKILKSKTADYNQIGAEKDKQIQAGDKKYRAEHRKVIMTKVVAGAIIVFESVVLVLTLLK
jgi:hypothetical protein